MITIHGYFHLFVPFVFDMYSYAYWVDKKRKPNYC